MNTDTTMSENMEKMTEEQKPEVSKRAYTRKDKKSLTFASVSELIEAKGREIEAIQAEIESLAVKRNELLFLESQEMGLINIFTDSEKFMRLAELVKESAHMNR